MARLTRAKWAIVLCAGMVCCSAGFAVRAVGTPTSTPSPPSPALPEEPAKTKIDQPRVLFPPDRAVLLSGDFDVICRGLDGPLKINDQASDWEPFEPPVRAAHVNLDSGLYQIHIGDRQLEVFVANSSSDRGAPANWPTYRRHPILGEGAKRCAVCHEIESQGERTAVGNPKSYRACFECHRPVEFEANHSHPLYPLEHCRMCHSLHSSTEKGLRKAPVKKLCNACHET